jgi:hypothetical protein
MRYMLRSALVNTITVSVRLTPALKLGRDEDVRGTGWGWKKEGTQKVEAQKVETQKVEAKTGLYWGRGGG